VKSKRSVGLTLAVSLALVCSLLVGGAASAAPRAAAKSGGTLTIVKAGDAVLGWDPIKIGVIPQNTPTPQQFMIYDLLVYEDPATTKVVPRIAQSFTTPDAGITWTLKLRPNVKFSDATAYDAAAVQFNWQRQADPANKATGLGAASEIQTMTVVDPLTLKVTLKGQDSAWDHRVATSLAWIASPTALQSEGAAYATKPVGAGPFLLKEWVRDDHYTFVKNPNYWEPGKPYLDGVVIKLITDDLARYNTFKSGNADVNYQFDPGPVAQAKQDGFILNTMFMPSGGWAFAMNNTKAPFTDVRVRKAIDLVLNRQQFGQIRRGNDASVVLGTVDAKGSPYFDPKIATPKTNVAAAQKLIDAYIADNGGKPVTFSYTTFQQLVVAGRSGDPAADPTAQERDGDPRRVGVR
jgi:peptide/nickel transport system substrate-binding protein